MSGLTPNCNLNRVYGPVKPSVNEMKGIRLFFPPDDPPGGGGGEYIAPATQEDLNKIIQDRVARALKPYESLKDLDLTDVTTRYGKVKDADIDALLTAQSELATVRASQGASEAELTSKITAAETRATTAETKTAEDATTIAELTGKVMRYDAAAKVGIPLSHALRLIGTTPEELEADATAYRATLRTPGYDPGQGQGGGGQHEGDEGKAEADRRFGSDK